MPDGRHVLVIDDDRSVRTVVRIYLEHEGYHVTEACDGDSGVRIVRHTPVDLILLDIEMPNMSGWDVMAQLQADPGLRKLPVIIFTARAEESSEWRAKELGAVAYIAKPVSIDDLVQTVARLLPSSE